MLETKTAHIYIKSDILFLIYNEKATVGVDEIEENLSERKKIQENKKMLTYVDVRSVWEYSPEARAIVGGDKFKEITIAMAVVVGYALPIKMIANFFMRINKPNDPTKLFKKEENAIEWLNSFK